MTWHVYVARCGDGTLYTGITTDPARREAAHNAGRGAGYTRARRPVKVVYTQAQLTHSQALKRERAIKNYTRREKLDLLAESAAA